jgi:type I restriction enzyme S subunit
MKLLEKHFEIALETPDGITRLRELILKLALQGKLVTQDENDESGIILVEKIKIEKQKLIDKGLIKKQKELEKIKDEEIPYYLPKGWVFERLNNVIDVRDGTHDSPKDATGTNTFPLVTSKNFINGIIDFDSARRISEEDHIEISKRSSVEKGDILFSMIGGNLGNQVMVSDDRQFSIKNLALMKFYNKDLTIPFFFKKYTEYLALDIQMKAKGGAQPFVGLGELRNLIIGLPPIEEQKRIVEKIDQLMLLCDKLEAERNSKNKLQLQINSAAINNLIKANDEISFNKAWSFIANQFDTLYTVKQNVTVLKDVILNLAIKGKLVGQNDNDESIENYLKKIVEEKNELLKKGLMKKQASFPIKDNDFPFSIPLRWNWIRLGEIVSLLGDGIHGTPEYDIHGEYYFINGNNLTDGKIEIKENTKTVSNEQFIKHKRNLNDKTVFVSINGTIGNVAFYNNEKIILGKSACYFNLVNVNKNYIKIIINSSYFLNYAFSSATGTTIKNVSLKTMRELPIPLPSLKEQERIVERVNQLFKLCNQLEKKIEQSSKKQSQLLNAVLAQV